MFKDKKDFTRQLEAAAVANFGKPFSKLEMRLKYQTLAKLIANNARNVRVVSDETRTEEKKRVYYFSMEFLMGKLLENYIMNFGIKDIVEEGLADYGVTISELADEEVDPGLGNGGLGRLAACFIDSLASLGYIGQGNGIRYRYGLFHQRIEKGCQVEDPDNWLEGGYPWEIERPEEAVRVRFGGTVVHKYTGNSMSYEWTGGEEIIAVPYDVPIVGYVVGRAGQAELRYGRLQPGRLRRRHEVPLRCGGHHLRPLPQRQRRPRQGPAPEAGIHVRGRRPQGHPEIL